MGRPRKSDADINRDHSGDPENISMPLNGKSKKRSRDESRDQEETFNSTGNEDIEIDDAFQLRFSSLQSQSPSLEASIESKRPKRKAAVNRKIVVELDLTPGTSPSDGDEYVDPSDDVAANTGIVTEESEEPVEIEPLPKKRRGRGPGKKNKLKLEGDLEIPPLLPNLSDNIWENSQLNTVANPFFSSLDQMQTSLRKTLNSMKDRVLHLFGYNQERIIDILKLQFKLQNNLLIPSILQISSLDLNELNCKLVFLDCQLKSLTFEQFSSKFTLRNRIDILYNKDSKIYSLSAGEYSHLAPFDSNSPKKGFVLNTGAMPIDTAWSVQLNSFNSENSRFHYLAVSISDTFSLTDARFSISASPQNLHGQNALRIYKVDTEELEISLMRSYIFDFGVMSNLKWVPWSFQDAEHIGVLGGVFSDGKLRFIKVELPNNINYCELLNLSKMFEIPDTKITSFDFISNESVVFGTLNGYIGEIDLTTETILYLYPLMTSGIVSVTSNYSDYYYDKEAKFIDGEYKLKNRAVFVASVDIQLFVDLLDISNQVVEALKTKVLVNQCLYIPTAHSYILNDGTRVMKIFTKRDLSLYSNIIKTEGAISSLAASRLHPLILGGTSYGEVYMTDSLRRVMNSKKSAISATFPTARLVKLDYSSQDKCFRLLTNNVLVSVGLKEVDSSVGLSASTICINSLSWNQNLRNGNWYAATCLGGLIVVECLPSTSAVRHYNGETEL